MLVARYGHFVYHQIMNVEDYAGSGLSQTAAAIGEPARARMLCCLMDGRAHTSTELAIAAEVSPSTASVHLHLLKTQGLVKMAAQGKHRYYSLGGPAVARAIEGLSVLAGGSHYTFAPKTPTRLCAARTCYDHMAGTLGVALYDRIQALGWLAADSPDHYGSYDLSRKGTKALETIGMDVEETRTLRRRFAFGCLDWSERRPHLGGALGAALLHFALKRKWVIQDLDSRALAVTSIGRREMFARFGLAA